MILVDPMKARVMASLFSSSLAMKIKYDKYLKIVTR